MRYFLLLVICIFGCESREKTMVENFLDSGLVIDGDGDGYFGEDDCDDQNFNTHLNAIEICDGIDNNCNNEIDEGVTETFYYDEDGDGFGDPLQSKEACELEGELVLIGNDCDDNNSASYPGAPEQCDGLDNDCDGIIDNDLTTAWYTDEDEDGFGDPDSMIETCSPDDNQVENGEDCDDEDDSIHPDADEICDEIDNDCDGVIDEGGSSIWYADADGDGHGNSNNILESCDRPENYVSISGDCDDLDSMVYPQAIEYCDFIDNNCDGIVDEDSAYDASIWYADIDGDEFGDQQNTTQSCTQPSGYIMDHTDCDDSSASINPIAKEYCNGADDDCDGTIDEIDAQDVSSWYRDVDGDGFGIAGNPTISCNQPTGYVLDSTDCDDQNSAIHPQALEICDQGIDNDCDGFADDDDPDGVSGQNVYYWDLDGDGFGHSNIPMISCNQPTGYVLDSTDCDDQNSAIHPQALEICDQGIDNDCDGFADDDDPNGVSGQSNWYMDSDGDGFGEQSNSVFICDSPTNYVSDATDCDDQNSAIHPQADEICDQGIDNDCDGFADDDDPNGALGQGSWYSDGDGDGYGEGNAVSGCSPGNGYVSQGSDCDDSNVNISPGASEICGNGIDDNCDGNISENCTSTFYNCGGPGALDSGQSLSCGLGANRLVHRVRVSAGCNDGESGYYTVSFSDGSSVSFGASCGTEYSFSPRMASSVSIYMHSGGGGDNHISWTCCGSSGWGMYYY